MRAVRIFQHADVALLQKFINAWLFDHPEFSVTDYLQSQSYSEMSGHLVVISIFYVSMEQ